MAQKISFGPTVGTYIPHKYGNNYQDSTLTRIVSQAGDGERTIGLFIEYEKSKVLSLRGEIIFFPDYTAFLVSNSVKKCWYCSYYSKAIGVSHNTIGFVPTVKVSLPLGNKFKPSLLGGLSLNFQKRKHPPNSSENGRDPAIWETYNALDEIVKGVVPYYHYGLSVQYGRFNLTGRYMKNMGKSIFNDIVVYGKVYKFYAQSKYIFVMLSYNLQGQLKKKKKEK